MAAYTSFFQIALFIYCIGALAFLMRPLLAAALFLFFRATFSIAAYLQVPSLAGLPFFIPSLLILLSQTVASFVTSKVTFRINHVFGTYLFFLTIVLIIGAIQTLMGTSLSEFVTEFSKYAFPILAYVLVYIGLKKEQDLKKIGHFLAIASLIPVLAGLTEFVFNTGLSYNTYTFIKGLRPSGTIIDPNLYGIYLSLSLFIALPGILKEKRDKKSLLYVLLVLFMIVVARNRGTWIALFLAFLCSVPLFKKNLSIQKWILGAVAIAILALPIFAARFAELNEYDQWGQKKNTGQGRYEYSLALLDHSAKSPLIGHGTGGYGIGYYATYGVPLDPHNDYLRVSTQYGFIAMFIYMLFFLFQFIWSLKHRHSRLWAYQFASCLCQIYVIIISAVQNLIGDTTGFMLLLSIMAISHRAMVFSQETAPQNEKADLPEEKSQSPRWVADDKKKKPLLGTKRILSAKD